MARKGVARHGISESDCFENAVDAGARVHCHRPQPLKHKAGPKTEGWSARHCLLGLPVHGGQGARFDDLHAAGAGR